MSQEEQTKFRLRTASFELECARINLSRGETTETGERSSNFFDLDDYKNLAEERAGDIKKWPNRP